MKKLLAAALVCSILMTSCSALPQNGASEPSETAPVISQPVDSSVTEPVTSADIAAETTPAEETSESNPQTEAQEIQTADFDSCENLSYNGAESEEYAPIASEIITALYNADTEYLCGVFGASGETVFDFVKDVKFNKICVTGSVTSGVNSILNCIVEMDVASSPNDIFPVGRSKWNLSLEFGASSVIGEFKPTDKTFNTIAYSQGSDSDNGAKMCYMITKDLTGVNNTGAEPSSALSEDFAKKTNSYYSLILIRPDAHSAVIEENGDDLYTVTSGELKELAERLFGTVDGFDPTTCSGYDEATDSLTYPARGGTWLFENLISHTVDSASSTHTVVIEYYADAARLVKAKTIEYTFTEDENGYYGNVRQKLVFDGGFDPASGCV